MGALADLDKLDSCWCHQCHHDRGEWVNHMILCPECGCKRCPHATHHDHVCTGSNDSDQPGSVYGDFHVDPDWEAKAAALRAEMAELDATRTERVADFRRRHNLSSGSK